MSTVVRKVAMASVVAALAAACGGVHAGGRPTPALVRSTAKGIGFSVPTFPWLSRSEQISWLKDFLALGITWIRFDVTWAVVRPARAGPYNWARYDKAVAQADRYGIHVDAEAVFSTPWANAPGCRAADSKCQPSSPRLYAAYAAAVARHFGHRVSAEEIWNEPNNVAFWHPAPDPAFYVRMLKDAYVAIKAADPAMIVVSGGLAPEPDNGTDISARTFAEDMFKYGARGYFDAFGYHPYSFPALPDQYEPWSAWSQMAETSPSIRSIMTANGQAAIPIWITEVGAPTGGPRRDSQLLQAAAITQIVRNERSLSFLGPAFIYSFKDLGTSQAQEQDFFGVVTARGSPKPSYLALKRAIGG